MLLSQSGILSRLALVNLIIASGLVILTLVNDTPSQDFYLLTASIFWLLFSLGRRNPVKTSFIGLSLMYASISLLSFLGEVKMAEGLAVVSLPLFTISAVLLFCGVFIDSLHEADKNS